VNRTRRAHDEPVPPADDADRRALRALEAAGVELGRVRSVRHYLVCTERGSAATATLQLREAGFDAVTTENPTAAGWMVVAERAEPLDEESIALTRSLFELIAERCGAAYDGWRTDVHDEPLPGL